MHGCQAYADTGYAVLGLNRHVRKVRRDRRVLFVVSGLRKLDVDLEPEHRLLSVDFAGVPINRDMEVLDPHDALSSEWAEESRQSLKDGRLARPVRAEDVGEFLKVDGGRHKPNDWKFLRRS